MNDTLSFVKRFGFWQGVNWACVSAGYVELLDYEVGKWVAEGFEFGKDLFGSLVWEGIGIVEL